MDNRDYYDEKKWCPSCNDYVRYMMSVDYSYCVRCSSRVRLFSEQDAERFNAALDRRKWKAS